MIRIGLTGGVASGKSTALTLFKSFGCAVFSSDDIVHKLFEKKLISEFDYSVVITAGLDIRVERFLNSSLAGRNQNDFFEISRNQMNDSKRTALADFVIKNNGSKEDLKFAIKNVLETIKKQKGF